jgi:hypothetical protein
VTTIDIGAVLNLPLGQNDAAASTVRDYLTRLLTELWQERDGFSGKRPFGNSGWEYDLYMPLIQAGVVEGTFDDDGYVHTFPDSERRKADRLIAEAIAHLGGAS